MQTVEFNATVENGVIPIPRRYESSVTDKVRVIVFPENNMEEANARR